MYLKKDIKDILVMVLGFWIISAVLYFKGKVQASVIIFSVITVIGLISLIIKQVRILILKGWFFLAKALVWINSRILLSLIYFLVLYPTSILQKMFSKKDNLLLKNKNLKSTFTTRNHTYKKKDLKYGW